MIELASITISAIVPYLVKGGEKIAEGVGKDLWELIKKPFKSDREKALIKELEDNPNDKIVQGKTIGKLEELLESDPGLVKELGELLKQLPKTGKTNVQTLIGTENIGIQDVSGSEIHINKDPKR